MNRVGFNGPKERHTLRITAGCGALAFCMAMLYSAVSADDPGRLLIAGLGIIFPIWTELHLRKRKPTAVSWDDDEVSVEVEGAIAWRLRWADFGGVRRSRRGYQFLDKTKNPVGVMPFYRESRLRALRRPVHLSLDEDSEMPSDDIYTALWSRRTFAIVIANGLVSSWFGITALVRYLEHLRQGSVTMSDFYQVLWLVPGTLLLAAAGMRYWWQSKGRPTRTPLEPTLADEWEDPRYLEAPYMYTDAARFRKACRGDLFAVTLIGGPGAAISIGVPFFMPTGLQIDVLLLMWGIAALFVSLGVFAWRSLPLLIRGCGLRLERSDGKLFVISEAGRTECSLIREPRLDRSPVRSHIGYSNMVMVVSDGSVSYSFDPALMRRFEERPASVAGSKAAAPRIIVEAPEREKV